MRRPPGSSVGRPRRKQEPPSAFGRALRYLTVRDRSERELRQKLSRAAHDAAEIDVAIERLRKLGYLDDAKFARARANSLLEHGRLGPRGAAARLLGAGVSREEASAAVRQAMSQRDELQLARAALERRHPDAAASSDRKVRARAARFLLGRGFSPEVVGRALELDDEGT